MILVQYRSPHTWDWHPWGKPGYADYEEAYEHIEEFVTKHSWAARSQFRLLKMTEWRDVTYFNAYFDPSGELFYVARPGRSGPADDDGYWASLLDDDPWP